MCKQLNSLGAPPKGLNFDSTCYLNCTPSKFPVRVSLTYTLLEDFLEKKSHKAMRAKVDEIVQSLRRDLAIEFSDLLFPAGHAEVKAFRKGLVESEWRCDKRCKCKGLSQNGATDSLAVKPKSRVNCSWRHQHWEYMVEHELDPNRVAKLSDEHRGNGVPTPRAAHVIGIKLAEAERRGTTITVVNASQSVGHANVESKILPCLTTSSFFYLVKHKRPLLAAEALIFQGYPMGHLDLGVNSSHELLVLAGNSMEVRSFSVAFLATMSIVNKDKFGKFLKDHRLDWRFTPPPYCHLRSDSSLPAFPGASARKS